MVAEVERKSDRAMAMVLIFEEEVMIITHILWAPGGKIKLRKRLIF